jgi:hypothetical protein
LESEILLVGIQAVDDGKADKPLCSAKDDAKSDTPPLKADRDARSEETAAILLERRKLLVEA